LEAGVSEEISIPMATIIVVPGICSAGSANEVWRRISSAMVALSRNGEK